MPGKLNFDDEPTNWKLQDDSDDEVVTVKRNTRSIIKSDESDDSDETTGNLTSSVIRIDDEPANSKLQDDSDDEVFRVKRNTKSRIKLDESDDCGETTENLTNFIVRNEDIDDESTNCNLHDNSDDEVLKVKRNRRRRFKSVDSDEITENVTNYIVQNEDNPERKQDYNDERNIINFPVQEPINKENESVESNSRSSNPFSNSVPKDYKALFSNKDLYDPEDSEDDDLKNSVDPEKSSNYDAEGSSDETPHKKTPISKKSVVLSSRRPKCNEKKNEVDEIHSETQRLIRRSRVSLPYHKPRQRSLAEFLRRRPSIPTKSIRMSTDELKLMAKEVRKRTKEAEEFYKSSSDEEQLKKYVKNVEDAKINVAIPSLNSPNDTVNEDVISSKNVADCNLFGLSVERNNDSKNETTDFCEKNIIHNASSSYRQQNSDTPEYQLSDSLRTKINSNSKDENENNPHEATVMMNQSGLEDVLIKCKDSINSKLEFETSDSSPSTNNLVISYGDLDSQDLCLRIEDTETLDILEEKREEMNERRMPNVELNFSVPTKQPEEDDLLGGGVHSLNIGMEEINSQSLNLRIENSESFQTCNHSQEEKNECSETMTKIIVTEENMSTANCKIIIEDSASKIEDSASKIEDSASKIEDSASKIEQQFDHSDDIANFEKTKVKISSSVIQKCFSGGSSSNHDGVELCNLKFYDEKCKTNFGENISSNSVLFKENTTSDGLVRNNSQIPFSNSASEQVEQDHTASCAEGLMSILNGEETRIAFEVDEKTSLNGSVFGNCKKSMATGSLSKEKSLMNVEIADLIDNSEEKTELFEKKKELSKKSSDLLIYTKDSPTENQETALSAIQSLRGSNGDISKDLKLMHKMSLLEDRLMSTRKTLKLQNSIPQLKGSPNKVIDLDDTASSCEINTLKHRFIQHSLPKIRPQTKSNIELSVVSAEKGPTGDVEVKKELITIESETESLLGSREKLLKLKEDLQRQIVKEREEEWKKRQIELQEMKSSQFEEEKSECCLFDDEEEILESDASTSQDEDEDEEETDEEDRFEKPTKSKTKTTVCTYFDDEADVSDGNEESDEELDDESENTENDDEHSMREDFGNPKENQNDDQDGSSETNAVFPCLKRSRTLDVFISQEDSYGANNGTKLQFQSTKKTFDSSQSQNADGDTELESSLSIPPYQPGGAISQLPNTVDEEESYINILPATLPTPLSVEVDSENIFSQFPQSSTSFSDLGIQNEIDADETELLDLCSGKFTSQPPELSQDESVPNSSIENILSTCKLEQMEVLSTLNQTRVCGEAVDQSNQIENGKENLQEKKNEKETEDSPVVKKKKKIVISSDDDDDDDDDENKIRKSQQKLRKKLSFSDDDSDEIERDESVIEDVEPLEVEYDSEENEVIVKTSEAKEFFENEAELSESEWGSDDEDEKGLDDFEVEAGDDEKLDQNKVKEQLGKIHLRRVLDEDEQEIKRLQELLLEDGEFHSEGGGRERQFRWKNLNNTDDLQISRKSDDELLGDEEEEDESQWRQMRFQRELFLQDHKNKRENEDITGSNSITPTSSVKIKFKCPMTTSRNPGQIKRGSFLTRSDTALARIAQITKNSSEINLSAPTNSRNFVFATLSQDLKDDSGGKRKPLKLETPVIKKMRLGMSVLDQIG